MKSESEAFLDGVVTVMQERGLKDAPFATAAGLGISYIRDLRRQKAASPRLENAFRIAEALDLTIDELIERGRGTGGPRQSVTIAGRVGAGAQVEVTDAYAKGGGPQVARPAALGSESMVAVEIVGNSMEPIYSEGDLLFYARDTADGVPSEAIGHRCVCEDSEGLGWVKQVRPGSQPGLFHLISLNPGAFNQHDVQLKWAAKVRLHWPADLVKWM